jgi:hypothetical protein
MSINSDTGLLVYELGITGDLVRNTVPGEDFDELPDLDNLLEAMKHHEACNHCRDAINSILHDGEDDNQKKGIDLIANGLRSDRLIKVVLKGPDYLRNRRPALFLSLFESAVFK